MSGGGDFDVELSDFDAISESDIEACRREFRTSGVEGCRRLLQVKQEEWKNIPLNVAVIGNSGVGKSSFINAIRCTPATDDLNKMASTCLSVHIQLQLML